MVKYLFNDLFITLAVLCLSSLAPLQLASASGPECVINVDDQQEIVSIHNLLRSSVYPPASNMRQLVS